MIASLPQQIEVKTKPQPTDTVAPKNQTIDAK